MNGSELHVQAGLWQSNGHRRAALFMEGEAPDRSNGGGLMIDALYRVALARGLHLTTDLDHLDWRPVRGWRVWVDDDGSITVGWPHFHPLLEHTPLDLPHDWLTLAGDDGFVVIFAGYALGMHEHVRDGASHPLEHLEHAAEMGALTSGVVPVSTEPAPAHHLTL